MVTKYEGWKWLQLKKEGKKKESWKTQNFFGNLCVKYQVIIRILSVQILPPLTCVQSKRKEIKLIKTCIKSVIVLHEININKFK